ncbi:receptor-like cytosolic serine/threonine-protein kinase RBK2 [Impatiens glandulifera]|uniref:receptor-like cytosolic serine/threonine-protein kinase RBK2 n=1 Tax=Impatiens glandulifera TaxID=253017 RepID=UPI001FB16CB1|nr:receptor-like cytosolic serine/threonine-protein kinase RBK2 [Impatiens glandulifera]
MVSSIQFNSFILSRLIVNVSIAATKIKMIRRYPPFHLEVIMINLHVIVVFVDESELLTTTTGRENKDSSKESGGPKNAGTPWRGFFGSMMSKGPALPSIASMSIRKSWSTGISAAAIDPNLDAGSLYCFKSSWKNFSLRDLEDATNKFSSDNIIGEGGYSEVYKGNMKDGQHVAIKRLTRGNPEEMTADFLSELGILVHVNHPNISNVIGYGVEGGMYLVLPLSPHGSLSSILTGDKEKLKWSYRYKIAVGTAQGIAYLHEGCQRRIIHRDIKAANVLLSEDFDAKVSDFGLAKWLPQDWPHLTVSQFEGTFGYLPPEFFIHGTVDEKTDVYAYGVLLLEIITGRMALDKSQKSLVMWARPLLMENKISEIIDPCLNGAYDTEQLSQMVTIVSMCLDPDPTDRPQMSKASVISQ